MVSLQILGGSFDLLQYIRRFGVLYNDAWGMAVLREERAMPMSPFLSYRAFDPEAIETLAEAYEHACHSLGLAVRDDQLNQLIAEHVIKLAQIGVRNPVAICLLTVREFIKPA